MKNSIQFGLIVITISAAIFFGYNIYLRETTPPLMPYSEFLSQLQQNNLNDLHLRGSYCTGSDHTGRKFHLFIPDLENVIPLMVQQELSITTEEPRNSSLFSSSWLLLALAFISGFWLIFAQKQKTDSSSGFGSKSQFTPMKTNLVTFNDIAGIDEAKIELREIVDFLNAPEKYLALGAKIPKGVLLSGPPGTGKTLLARAIAGEASVSFFSLGGSDFVEMFVGVGASRVRELFQEAKQKAPCIIFIDEIDAIGARRSATQASVSNDEREQTLNALLVEMDGFRSDQAVIVIGATNRPDILDPALSRPGRFDRRVALSLPDVKGRRKILDVHLKAIIRDHSVDGEILARSVPGFSGADLANLVNEAALIAGRKNKTCVSMDDFEEAKDKIMLGLERKNLVISEQERRTVAYHEAGHAIIGLLLEETDPLHKISIIPRGRAMGITQQIPLEEHNTYTREYLVNRIKIALGGRTAELLVFNRLTTGASDDINMATIIASRVVCEWGMGQLGPVAFMDDQDYLARSGVSRPKHSEATAQLIDKEINQLISECQEEVTNLLHTHNKFLHRFAEVLLLNETMDAEEADIVYRNYIHQQAMEKQLTAAQETGQSSFNEQ